LAGSRIAAISSGRSVPPSNIQVRDSLCPGRAAVQSTDSSSPGSRSSPSSSRTSRWAAARGDSSISTTPPGISQPGLYVGSTSNTLPASSVNSMPAPILLRGRDLS
jgi:hypothetical protein